MPYKKKGKCVYKKDTGAKVGCTKGSVKNYLAALHANADKSEKNKEQNESFVKTRLNEELNKKLNHGKQN